MRTILSLPNPYLYLTTFQIYFSDFKPVFRVVGQIAMNERSTAKDKCCNIYSSSKHFLSMGQFVISIAWQQ